MLEKLFSPQAIALIGASAHPGKLGHEILKNLVASGFKGPIYPINPKAESVLGIESHPDIRAVKEPIDLAIIAIPADFVLDALRACGECRVGAAVVISAGFRETGHEGLLREIEMANIAKEHHMMILGPNCLGVIDTITPMNASFAASMPLKGEAAFMSQSGALCTSIIDISLSAGLGFSRFVSLGNKAHLNELDFMEAWIDDPHVKIVMGYLEGITDGARFMELSRRLTKKKPFVAIKSGSTGAGSRAVSSHTGTLAGSEKAYEAAFRQSGIIRAESITDLFDFSASLVIQPLPSGDRIAVVTNAGGPGIMAADAIERAGLRLARLSRDVMDALSMALPPAASVLNPVDVLGDALAERYRTALELVTKDPGVDALIVILTPQIMTQANETARVVVEMAKVAKKTVIACFIGDKNLKTAQKILEEGNIPNFITPERAVAVLKVMWDQKRWKDTPIHIPKQATLDRDRIRAVIEKAKNEGRAELGEAEGREIVSACGLQIPTSRLCKNPQEAVESAEEIGYPVVMKIASPDILHKTDIGGVRLDIKDAREVRDAFDLITLRAQRYMPDAEIWGCLVQKQIKGDAEVIIGMNRDPQFGPLVMFGLGGIYVEILKDISFRIAPFSKEEALEMISEIRSAGLLYGARGTRRLDIDAIAETLLKVSGLVTEFPEIVEMDINPLVVFEEGWGVMGLDVRFVLKN
ncbi:MAG: acetate--CoA ligase family protein [Dissulfurimicrobium hydrothermale]|uniref:acetate--CoA ligase family protein n=1 Tax=Dissulfurimicrobium hydrothermale TaxID=1750598 RepID=UPI003C7518FD